MNSCAQHSFAPLPCQHPFFCFIFALARLPGGCCNLTILAGWCCPQKVYLRQLVCVSDAWRVPQLTGFLDERASMMGVQTQIGEVLDQMDRMSSLCVDYQHQVTKNGRRGAVMTRSVYDLVGGFTQLEILPVLLGTVLAGWILQHRFQIQIWAGPGMESEWNGPFHRKISILLFFSSDLNLQCVLFLESQLHV